MKQATRKVLSILLAIIMVVGMLPAAALTAEAAATKYAIFFQNNWKWTDVCLHYWGSASTADTSWPGVAMEKYGNDGTYDIYKATIPTDVTGIVISGIKDDGSGNRDQSPNIEGGYYDGICYYMLWNNGNKVGSENVDVILPTDYYLVGYINGADHGSWDDAANLGNYRFENGKLTATFTKDSYVFVKTNRDNWYMTAGWQGEDATQVILQNNKDEFKDANKLFVPAGVEANFEMRVNLSDDTITLGYTITTCSVSFNAGEGSGSMTGATVNKYAQYELPASGFTAPEGKRFKAWKVGDSEYAAGEAITVTADTTVTAVWENVPATTYTVTATASPAEGGTVTGTGEYEEGKTATLTATANEGYTFVNWTENGTEVSTDAEYTFTVTTDRELVANFEETAPATYTVSIADGIENGTVSADKATAAADETVTLTVAPAEGYELDTLTVDGENVTEWVVDSKYIFRMPAKDVTVSAIFAKTVDIGDMEASVTVGGETSYYPTLEEAVDAAEAASGDATVTLLKAAETEADIDIQTENKITLDLNGKTITSKGASWMFYVMESSLTIQDSSEAKTGAMIVDGINTAIGQVGGTVNLTGGTLRAHTGIVVYMGGTFNMTGGKICSENYNSTGVQLGDPDTKANITGGTLASYANIHTSGTVTVGSGASLVTDNHTIELAADGASADLSEANCHGYIIANWSNAKSEIILPQDLKLCYGANVRDTILVDSVITTASVHPGIKAVDNKDGETHDVICSDTDCAAVLADDAAHDYTYDEANHKCICGYVEQFLLTLHGNGGLCNGQSTIPALGYYNQKLTLTKFDQHFTREHYTFKGWNTKADGSGETVTEWFITGDATLYAQWQCLHENTKAVDNKDGKTHSIVCTNPECGETIGDPVMHDYNYDAENHKCVCGAVETYTVTWKNIDGQEVYFETVEYGAIPQFNDYQTPTYPAGKMEEGYEYTWTGWSDTMGGEKLESLPAVTGDEDYYAFFETTAKQYSVVWYVDDTFYKETYVVYGEAITAPEVTGKEGYTFAWADIPETMPAKSITINGGWTVNKYDITWIVDGSKTVTEDVAYGTVIERPEAPTKEGHTFTGWEGYTEGMTMPDEAVTFTAQWEAKTYTVTWTVDGETYTTTEATYGEAITQPETDPEKVGHSFTGWTDVPETMPDDEALTIAASFTANTYTVDWFANGGYIFFQGNDRTITNPAYGAVITAPANVRRTGYTLTGWNTAADGSGKALTAETTMDVAENGKVVYYAQWDANQYTITFDTDGGTEIAPITQDYGTAVTAPADPAKEGYTFAGWDKEIPATMPAGDVTIKANWTVNAYTITFDTDGGTEIAPITQDYGTTVTAPADPTKEGYTFAGWDKEIPATMPAENVTITATWTVNSYTVTFAVNGEDYKEVGFAYGEKVIAPEYEVPAGHTFSGWTIPETMPAENITLDATLTINQYTITWKDDQGNTLYTEDLYYGTMPAFDAEQSDKELSKACHILSWSPEIVEVTENATYTAVWTLAHTGETEVRDAREATCTEDGYTGDTYCLGCGEKLKDGETITAPGHSHGTEWESDEKQHWHECECGDKADIADHTGGEATCKEPAQCEICGEAYGETDPENHTGETEIRDAKEATDTEDGYTGDTYCLDCGALLQKGEVIPATKPSVPSTPVKPLWKIWLEKWHEKWHDGCDKVECDHEYTDEVVEPTCCQKGYTVHTCDKCGFKYCDTYTEALGHAWDAGEVTKEASCTENGEKTYTCEVCGETRTEVICATGHDYEDGTCTHCGEAEKPCKPCKPIIWPFFWRWLWKAR